MAVALPLYISAVVDSRKKVNRANMHSVATAVQAAYVNNQSAGYSNYSGPVSSAKEPDLTRLPSDQMAKRTAWLSLSANGGAFLITCFDTDAGTFEPGYDNQ